MAVQRRQRKTSPRNSALSRAMNSGAVKDSAVARAIGVSDSADEEGQHREHVQHRPHQVQADPLGAEDAEAVARQQRQDHHQPEQVAEEGDLDRRQQLGRMPDRRVHGGEHHCRDQHVEAATRHGRQRGEERGGRVGAHGRDEGCHGGGGT